MKVDVGVVIGRFQVDVLHEGHRFLINRAIQEHRRVIIFVGCPPISGTKHDPLDYPTRCRMLQAEYKDATVLPIYDQMSDEVWSENLDVAIRGVVPNVTEAIIYGGRNSFRDHYTGKYVAVEVDSGIEYLSGSAQREAIGKVVRNSADFRAGVVYSTQNSWPYVKMCVDIALMRLLDKDGNKLSAPDVLLGKKPGEHKFRLPGGMVDPKKPGKPAENLEAAAARELREETDISVEVDSLEYITSIPVGDWRFKKAGEIGLLTALFATRYLFGAPRAGDDLAEVSWVSLNDAEKMVMRAHKPLIKALKRRFLK